ncbi:hypothetical protein [Streptomyces sp. JNUCC 63]
MTTHKVQTAVTGRPGTDRPVFLSLDHDFHYGILLGRCGKKLTAKQVRVSASGLAR